MQRMLAGNKEQNKERLIAVAGCGFLLLQRQNTVDDDDDDEKVRLIMKQSLTASYTGVLTANPFE